MAEKKRKQNRRYTSVSISVDTWVRMGVIRAKSPEDDGRISSFDAIINRALDALEREMEGKDA